MATVLAPVGCPLCGGDAALSFADPSARVHRCAACRHRFTDPASIAEAEAYGDDYYEVAHANWNANPDHALFDRVLDRCAALAPGGALLDVGCGRMAFLARAAATARPWRLHGVDLGDHRPPHPAIRYRGGGLDAYAPGERFDIVTAFMVIEHVADPIAFAARLAGLCRPGGVVVVDTIDESSVLYATARALARAGVRGPARRLYAPHHLHHFSRASLARTLRAGGLRILAGEAHDIPLVQIDHGRPTRMAGAVVRTGVAGCFALGRATGRRFAQTVYATPA